MSRAASRTRSALHRSSLTCPTHTQVSGWSLDHLARSLPGKVPLPAPLRCPPSFPPCPNPWISVSEKPSPLPYVKVCSLFRSHGSGDLLLCKNLPPNLVVQMSFNISFLLVLGALGPGRAQLAVWLLDLSYVCSQMGRALGLAASLSLHM